MRDTCHLRHSYETRNVVAEIELVGIYMRLLGPPTYVAGCCT